MKKIGVGKTHSEIFHSGPEHLASSLGNYNVDVVATTALILFFEEAATNLISPYYDDDDVTVGTHVNVDHVAPAHANKPVTVNARLTSHNGRRLEFELNAVQGGTIIMQGQHHRAIMSKQKFSATAATQSSIPAEIDFWFDFHSPWCYFASHQIGGIAREFNTKLNWRPVHLANLSEAVDGRRPLEANENFVQWYKQDQLDTASILGLPFEPHEQYPKRPSRALRGAIYASENNLAEPFVKSIMGGYWSEQKDISDMSWVRKTGEDVGLDGLELEEAMTSPAYKEKLGSNLSSAIEQKLFGLPACVCGDKLFWGNDRLDLLRKFLASTTL